MRQLNVLTKLTLAVTPFALLAAGCAGGGGAGSIQGGFQLTSISITSGSVWQINRPIEFVFNQDVDFATVNLNTINVQAVGGAPAAGSFSFVLIDTDGDTFPDSPDPRRIIFQPRCPLQSDLSDAGLTPGGVAYTLNVVGQSSGSVNTVRSTTGAKLRTSQTRNFTTPTSTQPNVVFTDTAIGPPSPVVRNIGSVDQDSSYVEISGDDGDRAYFEFDGAQVPGSQYTINFALSADPTRTALPLNLYSCDETKVAVMLVLNQAVNPDASNINTNRVRLEFLDGTGTWQNLDTRLQLVINCSATGATLRMEPVGILPQASQLRVVLLPGFQDLVGETNLLTLDDFGVAPTDVVNFTSLTPADELADEFLESFDFGSASVQSFEDADAVFDTPRAKWESGELIAAFEFNGTGGPNGDFDWIIPSGTTVNFDTISTTVSGGPGGIPTAQATFLNGVADVRDLIIEPGAILQVRGSNTAVINATRDIIIRGTLDISGDPARDVITLNTGNTPEPGAPGQAGGGDGGIGSWVTNNSTPNGGPGQGAFAQASAGGYGGESGFSTGAVDNRRPGGGGGGGFGPNEGTLIAETGWNGNPNSTGAVSQTQPAPGGMPGPGPFTDGDGSNDFWGVRLETDMTLTTGELPKIWAGAGGGAGGDAIPASQFPHPAWTKSTDEKGGPGGGGAGGLHLKALGRVVFGNAGTIKCNGGKGATGENTSGTNHVGGSGGGGSGGHVVIETAAQVDFTDGNPVSAPSRDYILATGGNGGVGWGSSAYSKGGKGGPGVVQIHVPDPNNIAASTSADIVRPVLAFGGLNDLTAPNGVTVIPTFGARSKNRSKWISVGGADQNPLGGSDLLAFAFEGIETVGVDAGKILTTDGVVDDANDLLGPEAVGTATVVVEADEVTLTISGASLDPWINDVGSPSNDIYLRNTKLLVGSAIKLQQFGFPMTFQDFEIVSAAYDDATSTVSITVDGSAGTLQDFVDSLPPANTLYRIVPRFFQISTGGTLDSLPDSGFVKFRFQATGADAFGQPDETNILVPWTSDISNFNSLDPGELQFFQFEIEFDLDALQVGLDEDTDPISVLFARIPFRF